MLCTIQQNIIELSLIIVIIFAIGTCQISEEQQFRIVGGNPVTINNFPYQVSVRVYFSPICGGVIISRKYVLTAAHCVYGRSSSVSVRAGSTYKNRGGSLYLVEKVTIHPRYNPRDNDYDVSILLLSRNLVFGPSMRPIVLPKPNENIGVGSMCVVSGWGLTQSPIPLQNINQLRAVRVPIVDKKSCRRSYGSSKITERMICAGFKKGGKDSCTADSGSPLVFKGKLIGLVSWGYGCGIPNYPGVYTKVSSLRQFIRNTTRL